MNRALRPVFYLLIGLLILIVVYFTGAFMLSRIPVNSQWQQPADGIQLYININEVHADFILPVQTKVIDWREYIPFHHFRKVPHEVAYMAVGWGDRGFYLHTPTWADMSFSRTVRALFVPSPAVMHVSYLSPRIDRSRFFPVTVSTDAYRVLVNRLLTEFEMKNAQLVAIEGYAYGQNDAFFEAVGDYHLFNTCNTWISDGLSDMGVRTGRWTPLSENLRYQFK